jgi:hypothetical protein
MGGGGNGRWYSAGHSWNGLLAGQSSCYMLPSHAIFSPDPTANTQRYTIYLAWRTRWFTPPPLPLTWRIEKPHPRRREDHRGVQTDRQRNNHLLVGAEPKCDADLVFLGQMPRRAPLQLQGTKGGCLSVNVVFFRGENRAHFDREKS